MIVEDMSYNNKISLKKYVLRNKFDSNYNI